MITKDQAINEFRMLWFCIADIIDPKKDKGIGPTANGYVQAAAELLVKNKAILPETKRRDFSTDPFVAHIKEEKEAVCRYFNLAVNPLFLYNATHAKPMCVFIPDNKGCLINWKKTTCHEIIQEFISAVRDFRLKEAKAIARKIANMPERK